MKQYFTFGQSHIHKVDGVVFDKNCVVEVEADTFEHARDKMFACFGNMWSMQYDYPPDMQFFPRGIIKLGGDNEDGN